MKCKNFKSPIPLLLAICLGFLLIGCMHRSISQKAGGTPYVVEIWASDACPKQGDTVTLRATATNVDPETQVVELKDQPVLDIVVGNLTDGQRWSAGKPLTPDLTRLELKPGESKSIEMSWIDQPISNIPVISARFIDDPRSINNPLMPTIVLGTSCYLIGP